MMRTKWHRFPIIRCRGCCSFSQPANASQRCARNPVRTHAPLAFQNVCGCLTCGHCTAMLCLELVRGFIVNARPAGLGPPLATNSEPVRVAASAASCRRFAIEAVLGESVEVKLPVGGTNIGNRWRECAAVLERVHDRFDGLRCELRRDKLPNSADCSQSLAERCIIAQRLQSGG